MLRMLSPDPVAPTVRGFIPSIAKPLLEANAAGQPMAPTLQGIVRGLEFDHFMYGVTTSLNPTQETRAFTWTSVPSEWVRLYDERSYIEVDPRLRGAWDSPLPCMWDRASSANSTEQRAFFDAAAEYGVCSGVALALRNRFDAPGIFILSSAIPANDSARQRHIAGVLGQVMVLAAYVHDLLLTSIVERCLPSPAEGRPLSTRERECLQLAAQGLSSREIGVTLSIGERTVHTHFANLLAKLGAANRHEAIAKASAVGLVAA
jgi:LuxR family transcriptional regulator, quorum-sensing system regulator SolR